MIKAKDNNVLIDDQVCPGAFTNTMGGPVHLVDGLKRSHEDLGTRLGWTVWSLICPWSIRDLVEMEKN